MNQNTLEKLDYFKLKSQVESFCVSSLGRKELSRLKPSSSLVSVRDRLKVTSEAKMLLDLMNSIAIAGTSTILDIVSKLEKDLVLTASELDQVMIFLRSNKRFMNQLRDKEFVAPYLYSVSQGIILKEDLTTLIEEKIKNGRVLDDATSNLKSIRRHILINEEKINELLSKFLSNSKNKTMIQEFFVTKRNNRYTIPIKATYKKQISGTIIDSTAKTVFIEPSTVTKYVTKLDELKIDEEIELYRILAELTNLVFESLDDIKRNLDTIGFLDLAFAKAKYSNAINGSEPAVNNDGVIELSNVTHPLLEGDVVPLNCSIGDKYRSLVITGPNAGGKTVVLKTIGLLTLAVQSGFHIHCGKNTKIALFDNIFVDIGDDQSIENALSTFSSHVKNLATCINNTTSSTLLLFDEIGSGTEPSEGAALAISILGHVYKRKAITVATTHYNEIKNYALNHSDFETAAMQFDKETLEPKYKLVIGQTGESNALWISKQMGIKDSILTDARKYMDGALYDFERVLVKKKVETTQEIVIPDFEIGDKVFVKIINKSGVVHSKISFQNMIEVFFEGVVEVVPAKHLTLEVSAKDLYPEGYNLDQIFITYKERKLDHDIKRGSKKALKKIQKYGIEELLK